MAASVTLEFLQSAHVIAALGVAIYRGVHPPLIYASHATTYGNESTRMTPAAREAEADARGWIARRPNHALHT